MADSLAEFANLVLAGRVPLLVRPSFFGATLLPFRKKDGGLRPIAVGLTLRRLISKLAASAVVTPCVQLLVPHQLGVGARGGAEALVHATRHYLYSKAEDKAFIKLDFKNAFNSVSRDRVLEAVSSSCPGLLAYVLAAYGAPSFLWMGDTTLHSEEGVQQGDPLGPLLFCLAVQPLLDKCKCEYKTGYLDDLGMGDSVPRLLEEIHSLESDALLLGLTLNHSKCEVVGLSQSGLSLWQASGLKFGVVTGEAASFLGSPLGSKGLDEALLSKHLALKEASSRLGRLGAHEAFYLLKASFGVPRLLYLLRSAPAYSSTELTKLNESILGLLSSTLNLQLNEEAWRQASLPVRWGGLGVRDVTDLAASAFLSSRHAVAPLIGSILPPVASSMASPLEHEALSSWTQAGGMTPPSAEEARRQKAWDDPVCCATFNSLLSRADRSSKARLLAAVSPDSGAWANTLPIRNLGLCLSDREIRVAAGLRIGAPIVREHVCVCRGTVDVLGHHGLSCRRSAGRQRRHALANDVLVRSIRAADVHAELEPHLFRDDGKRPDGTTVEPWRMGKFLAWDFTCPDSLAPSHVAQSASFAGSAAASAEQSKRAKYAELTASNAYIFAPVAVETLGTWGESAADLCRDIGSRLAALSGDPRSHQFLVQRLALAVQRGNAASVAGTQPHQDVFQCS